MLEGKAFESTDGIGYKTPACTCNHRYHCIKTNTVLSDLEVWLWWKIRILWSVWGLQALS